MTSITRARLMGALFLLAFVFYGSGSALVDAADHRLLLSAGALLILLNSCAVIAIGLLAFPILRRTREPDAYTYLIARIFEAVVLAVSLALTLHDRTDPWAQHTYWLAMLGLSLGSLAFCRVLLQTRLVPRPLAVLGLLGYTALALGAILELLGHHIGLALSAPGGLFELILGVLLITRGFARQRDNVNAA